MVNGKAIKYETPKGWRMALDVHPFSRPALDNPAIPLIIAEGLKKADALISAGARCVVALLGAWNFRGRNAKGGLLALADWDGIALNGRLVYLILDSDAQTNPDIWQARERLAAFLRAKGAIVQMIGLSPAPDGTKRGADDLLAAGMTLDQVLALAVPEIARPTRKDEDNDQDASGVCPYRATSFGMLWQPPRDNTKPVKLANFSAAIVEDVIGDDGTSSPSRAYGIEVRLGHETHRVMVSVDRFAGMAWVAQALGPRAIITAGMGMTDHLRAAIQSLSETITPRRIYQHSGWRTVHGQDVYLHAGGALGADGPVEGIDIALPDALSRYRLPLPPQGEDRRAAIRCSLALLGVADWSVTRPGLAYTYRSVISATDYALGYVGRSGVGKSSAMALLMQHLGAGMAFPFSVCNWFNTANAIGDLQFSAKDAPLSVDDFVPSGTRQDRERLHGQAARVIRGQANQAGRRRMRRDGTLAPERPPRGSTIWTGEDVFQGESLQVRSLTIACWQGMVNSQRLEACRQDADAGRYAEAMAAFIQWLAPRRQTIIATWGPEVMALRKHLEAKGHPRTPMILADLALGWKTFLAFALDADAITSEERDRLWQRLWQVLEDVGAEQGQALAASEPAGRSLALLSAAVASGRAHLANLDDNQRPGYPLRYGWREHESESTDDEGHRSIRTEWRAHGDQIGYINDQGEVYLESQIAYALAARLADADGEALGIGVVTWKKRLHERHLLASTEKDGQKIRLEVRRTVAGVERRILHIRSDVWHTPHSPYSVKKVDEVDENGDSSYFTRQICRPLGQTEKSKVDVKSPLINKAESKISSTLSTNSDIESESGSAQIASTPSPAALPGWRGAGPFLVECAKAGIQVAVVEGHLQVPGDREPWAGEADRHYAEILAMLTRPPCLICRGTRWWIATAGGVFCQQCRPASFASLVAMTFETAGEPSTEEHGADDPG
jgi:hypothetical protein